MDLGDNIEDILGICNDISLENKTNIFLEVIKVGNHEML